MRGHSEELLWSELAQQIQEGGCTLAPDAEVLLKSMVAETAQYLQRDRRIALAAHSRLKRLLARLILNVKRHGESVITAAAVSASRHQSSSWVV